MKRPTIKDYILRWTAIAAILSAYPFTIQGASSWSLGVTLNPPRNAFGIAVGGDGKIYTIGGNVQESGINRAIALVECFDEGSQQWETVAPLPFAVMGCAAATDKQGVIWVFGGADIARNFDTVLRYDYRNNQWTVEGRMSLARNCAEAAIDSLGRIYLVGGQAGNSTLKLAERFDPDTGQWTTLPPLNRTRAFHALLIDSSDRVYAFGGGDGAGINSVERYDPNQPDAGWIQVGSMPAANLVQGTVGHDGQFYLIGGWCFGYTARVDRYDPMTGIWSPYAALSQGKNNMGAVTAPSGRIYVMGGDAQYTPVATVEYTDPYPLRDTEPPIIICPTDIVVPNDSGLCSTVVNYALPSATDNRPGVLVVCDPPSGTVFQKGANLVACIATDAAGNTATCSFTVAVNDTEPPVITAPAGVTVSTDPGQCSATGVSLGTPITSDNCGVATAVNDAPPVFPKGTTTVTWAVTDTAGNSAIATQTVTVQDQEAPRVLCHEDISLGCSVDSLVPASYSATATDNCDPTPQVTCVPPSGSGFGVGTTLVQCIATDADGNSSACSFRVNRAPLAFTGFLPPIGGADSKGGSFANPLKTFKMGSTVPVRFTAACDGAPVVTGTHRLQVIKYADETTAAEPIDATPQDAATTGNEFRLADGQWHFNLDTKATGMSTGKWLIVALLSDGSQHVAWIQLR